MKTNLLPGRNTLITEFAPGEILNCAARRVSVVERELDASDIQLLKAAATAGEVIPATIHQQRRLDRLDQEGYVESTRRDHAESDAPSCWVYRLTRKGHKAVERSHL